MIAIVPVKAVSKRLPGKNLLPFGESNLLQHKLEQLSKVHHVEEIVVSSDSSTMLSIAREMGHTALERPREFADGTKSFSQFIGHLLNFMPLEVEILWACVTSPLVDETLYTAAIETFREQRLQGKDSLVSVTALRHHIFDENGPANFEIGPLHPDSQDLDPIWLFTNGIVISTSSTMREHGDHFGPNPFLFEVSQVAAVDIDTELDYEVAKAAYKVGLK